MRQRLLRAIFEDEKVVLFQIADDARGVFLKYERIDRDEVDVGFYYLGDFDVCFSRSGIDRPFASLR